MEITCAGPFNVCGYIPFSVQTLDAADTSITYAYSGDGSIQFIAVPGFSGFEFAKLDAGGNMLGPIVLSTNISGLDIARLTNTSSLIRIDMRGLSIPDGSFFTVSFASDGAVPEPSSWALLFTGLGAGVAAHAARRRRN